MTGQAGLFGHIQRNNAKSLAMMVFFLCLMELTQIGLRLIPIVQHVNMTSRFGSVSSQFETVSSQLERKEKNARPKRRVRTPPPTFWEKAQRVWSTFVHQTSFFSRDWYVILIAGLAYLGLACWYSSVLMRYATRARLVSRTEAPELYNLVENLAVGVGLPTPRIEMIETPKMNAYATGFFPSSSTIGVTRGLVERLTRDELEAVIAHELIHIRDRDVRLMIMARACNDMVLPLVGPAVALIRKHPFLTSGFVLSQLAWLGLTFALILAGLIGLVALLLAVGRMAISRTREFTADAGAIELTKAPEALISALRKVAGDDVLPVSGYTTRAMMFSNSLDSLFATHPGIEERIEAIRLHGGVTGYVGVDALPRRAARVVSGLAEAPKAVFGRKRVVAGDAMGRQPDASVVQGRVARASSSPWATAASSPQGQQVFGQRPVDKVAGSIAMPLLGPVGSVGDHRPDQPNGLERIVLSGALERAGGWIVKLIMLPWMMTAAFSLIGLMFVLVYVAAMIHWLVACALVAGAVYLFRVRIMDGLAKTLHRFSDA